MYFSEIFVLVTLIFIFNKYIWGRSSTMKSYFFPFKAFMLV